MEGFALHEAYTNGTIHEHFSETKSKFLYTSQQIDVLQERLHEAEVRYDRAAAAQQSIFMYSQRLKIVTLDGAIAMLQEYADRKAVQLITMAKFLDRQSDSLRVLTVDEDENEDISDSSDEGMDDVRIPTFLPGDADTSSDSANELIFIDANSEFDEGYSYMRTTSELHNDEDTENFVHMDVDDSFQTDLEPTGFDEFYL